MLNWANPTDIYADEYKIATLKAGALGALSIACSESMRTNAQFVFMSFVALSSTICGGDAIVHLGSDYTLNQPGLVWQMFLATNSGGKSNCVELLSSVVSHLVQKHFEQGRPSPNVSGVVRLHFKNFYYVLHYVVVRSTFVV